MQLQLRTFDTMVASAAAAVQAAARTVLDLSVGSVLRAVLEANAGLGLWLQWLILEVLQTTRAATSSGADLDSWMADFQLTRQVPVASVGRVTFGRLSAPAGSAALVPAGTTVRTGDGTLSFTVVADATDPAWNAALRGYTMAASASSVSAPVAAAVAGGAGNVLAGAVSLIAAALPGVDTVTNPLALSGGIDGESDAAFRARFAAYLISLFKATPAAIGYAISTVQQGLQYTIQENALADGARLPGFFVVTIDDGSGAPSPALLTAVATAIEAVRPVGCQYVVVAPVITFVDIVMTITTAQADGHANAVALVTAAITAYVNSLPVGATLAYSRLAQVAYDATPAVSNVTAVTIAAGTNDIPTGPNGVVKLGSVMVT